MITVSLHENTFELTPNISLADALAHLKIQDPMYAIAINKTFIPRSQYRTTTLHDGDKIELVTPMQGG